ncbi:MAG TPA: HD-GYP domain-containing protein, partial [Candidatus Lustribacter sp.]|nr:HD-GYP domain-containing protein [Candidatus Lustribacter sp.]
TKATARAASPLRVPTIVYISAVCVAAVGLFLLAWRVAGPPRDWVAVVVLTALVLIGHVFRERDVGSRVSISFASIVLLASVAIVGPVAAGAISVASIALDLRSYPLRVTAFNAGMNATYSLLGALAYVWVGGRLDVASVDTVAALFSDVGLPLIAADAAQMVANAGILAGIMHIDGGMSYRSFLVSTLRTTGPAYFGYGIFGFLFALLWIPAGVGPFSSVLIVAPLVVARWAFTQYGDELRAHERTLSSLVTSVETKNPFAAGHGERVAAMAQRIGEVLTLGGPQLHALRYAAMLHDVGTISIPSRFLLSPGPLTEEAIGLIEAHPAQGVSVISNVDFLRPSLEGVRHHHERFDGSGYPDGLVGEQIPLFARVVAVADTFDSLTITRESRPAHTVSEALDMVLARSGSQFDPQIVRALQEALDRQPWTPATPPARGLVGAEDFFDHDDPDVSDLLADRRRDLCPRPPGHS